MSSLTGPRRLLKKLSRAPSIRHRECHHLQPGMRSSGTRLTLAKQSCAFSTTKQSEARASASRQRDAAPKNERKLRPNSTNRVSNSTSQPTRPSHDPSSPELDAMRAAEARDSTLRAARLRRALQRQEEALEGEKKEQAKKDYQKRYNTTKRKWVSSIVAMPILLVTSYYLFDRLVLRNEPKEMPTLDKGEKERIFLSVSKRAE
ncbi:hypothetical protein ACJZ2D_007421 [Fusarium nematophilum]